LVDYVIYVVISKAVSRDVALRFINLDKFPITCPYRFIGIQKVEAPIISRHSTYEDGKVSATHRPPLPPRKYSWYSFLFEVLVDPRAIVRPEGLSKMKNPNDSIENRTRGLPACSIMLQLSASPATTVYEIRKIP
jgi:hypothetical protein